MEKEDASRAVMLLAAAMLKDILAEVKLQVYAGPDAVVLSPAAARKQFAGLTGQQRLDLSTQLGIDEFISQAQALAGPAQ